MSSDRNLLAGVLALQMDFVSGEQLLAGMNAWMLRKDRPLLDVLRERGADRRATSRRSNALVSARRAARRRRGEEPGGGAARPGRARPQLDDDVRRRELAPRSVDFAAPTAAADRHVGTAAALPAAARRTRRAGWARCPWRWTRSCAARWR